MSGTQDVHMEAGQVGFHDDTNVRTFHVEQRDRQILKRINKTLREEFPDLNAERQQRDLEERARFQAVRWSCLGCPPPPSSSLLPCVGEDRLTFVFVSLPCRHPSN